MALGHDAGECQSKLNSPSFWGAACATRQSTRQCQRYASDLAALRERPYAFSFTLTDSLEGVKRLAYASPRFRIKPTFAFVG